MLLHVGNMSEMPFSRTPKQTLKGLPILITIATSLLCTLLVSADLKFDMPTSFSTADRVIEYSNSTAFRVNDEEFHKETAEFLRTEADKQGYKEDQEILHPRIALLFMIQSPCFYMEPLWVKYLQDEPANDYMIVVHQQGVTLDEPEKSYMDIAFMSPDVRSHVQGPIHYVPTVNDAKRFTVSLARTGLLLAKHAYHVDPSVTCFILLSETTIPLISLSELRKLLIRHDGHGNWTCRSNIVPQIRIPNGNAAKVGQWFVASRWHIKLLVTHNSAEVDAMEKYYKIRENATVGIYNEFQKGEIGAPDEMLFPTALNSVLSRLTAEGGFLIYQDCMAREAQVAEDSKVLQWNLTLSFFNMKTFRSVASILEDFVIKRPDVSHPIDFDASFLAEISIAELNEMLPDAAFFRKVIMRKASLLCDGEPCTCPGLKEHFEDTISISNLHW